MCGIVGYIGKRNAIPIVMDGLRRLEYRGYDSAGLAVLTSEGQLQLRKEAGKLVNLDRLLAREPVQGTVAIGHTRWATHGPPCRRNAHPHPSPDGQLVVVQNGIVENFQELRQELEAQGYTFHSDTDTEVISHLVHRHYTNGASGDLPRAVRQAVARLRGPSAIVVFSHREPDKLVVARLGNAGGVAIGKGEEESFIASDIPALLGYTRRVLFLDNGQMAVVRPGQVEVMDFHGQPVTKEETVIQWDAEAAQKGEYAHFMQKEIFEQGQSVTATLRQRVDFARNRVRLESLNLSPEAIRRLSKIHIVACGTSYYAGLVGKFLIEHLARIPVEVDYGSEFRYREPLLGRDQMVLAITQSGETVDTLAALDEARSQGAFTAAIVNVVGSQADRVCDGTIHMQAGPEIGVASTKAFTTSLVDLFLLAVYLGEHRGALADHQLTELVQEVTRLPGLIGELLAEVRRTGSIQQVAQDYHQCSNFLYLGRGIQYPIALEGALKIKEISYIHAEGYPAGEMKHGPIALIDEEMPTVVVAPRSRVYDKMVSQIEQVKARSGKVIAVANQGDEYVASKADAVLSIPAIHEMLAPVLAVIPLQLLAYEIALLRGTDVDQPRNLAKSVTVE